MRDMSVLASRLLMNTVTLFWIFATISTRAALRSHYEDVSGGAALYAQRALKFAGESFVEERAWQLGQLSQLPDGLAELIETTLLAKARGLGL